jgi:hypothetical protein
VTHHGVCSIQKHDARQGRHVTCTTGRPAAAPAALGHGSILVWQCSSRRLSATSGAICGGIQEWTSTGTSRRKLIASFARAVSLQTPPARKLQRSSPRPHPSARHRQSQATSAAPRTPAAHAPRCCLPRRRKRRPYHAPPVVSAAARSPPLTAAGTTRLQRQAHALIGGQGAERQQERLECREPCVAAQPGEVIGGAQVLSDVPWCNPAAGASRLVRALSPASPHSACECEPDRHQCRTPEGSASSCSCGKRCSSAVHVALCSGKSRHATASRLLGTGAR